MMRRKARFFSAMGGRSLVLSLGLVASATGCGAVSSEPHSLGAHAKGEAAAHVSPAKMSIEKRANKGPSNDASINETKSVGLVAAALGGSAAEEARGTCRRGMVSIEGRYCIDRYEGSLVEVMANGDEEPFSAFSTVGNHHVRAVSEANVHPQGYISAVQAERACVASGKRLCQVAEWQQACRGPENKQYGYADRREPGRCNDNGRNPIVKLFGFRYDASTMNQPQLNRMEGTLAKTGAHSGCSNGYGVYDMVGNLHEWVADPRGTFYGGYYQDVSSVGHGDGCGYVTTAHAARYHDYSTGFRCCADLAEPSHETTAAAARPTTKTAPRHGPRRR